MATERFSSSGGGDATELLGAQVATSPVTSLPMPTNARPEARRFCIQLYAKGRSDTAQDHNRFADFVTENLGHLGPSWAITAEPPPACRRAPQEILLVQARAEFRGSDGCTNDDVENLAAILREAEIHSFPQNRRTTCLFLRLLEIDQLGEHHDKVIAARLLDGLVAHERLEDDIIARGKRSTVDIAKEVAFTVTGISIAVYGAVETFQALQKYRQRQQAGSNQTNAAMRSWPAPADTTWSRTVWKDLENLANAFTNAASTPPWVRGQLRTIAQARRALLASLRPLDAAFNEAKGWVQAWSTRGKVTDTGEQLSSEEVIQFAQLIGSLSRSADDTAAVLDVLSPLLDERYILPEAANTFSAVTGAVVALAVAFFWWNPVGWTAGALGTAASFVAAHGTASAVTIGAGGVTAAVCGLKAKIGHDQRRLMDEVRNAKATYQDQKNYVLRTLVLILVGEEQFQHLGHQDQKNICDRMGIQISLLGENGFKAGALKTMWEELEKAYNSYCSSLRAAAVVIESSQGGE